MLKLDFPLPSPVLILEDEPLVQNRFYEIFTRLGYQKDQLYFSQTIKQAKTLYQQQTFAFVLVDLGLPDGTGLDFIHFLHELGTSVPIMVISAWSSSETIFQALASGATGYVLKERDDIEIILAIRSILRGGSPIDPFIATHILKHMSSEKVTAPNSTKNIEAGIKLSSREQQILTLVADGNSSREIAELIHISRFTVECHIKNIYQKLSVNSRTKAISLAKKIGLL